MNKRVTTDLVWSVSCQQFYRHFFFFFYHWSSMKIAFAPTIENKAEHHIHLILEACK